MSVNTVPDDLLPLIRELDVFLHLEFLHMNFSSSEQVFFFYFFN